MDEPLPSLRLGQRVAISPSKAGRPTESSPLASEPPDKKKSTPSLDSISRETVREVSKREDPGAFENGDPAGTKAPAPAANEK